MIRKPAGPGAPILVVEDDAAVRELLVSHLGRKGFPVREAANGEAALRLVDEEAVSLLILDMQMPGLSGTDVIRSLRARSGTATLPIMVLTGQGDAYPLAASLGIGADDYLTKPIELGELVARIRARLRSRQVAAEQAQRDSELLYRALVEHAADGILVSDRTGRYVEANQAVCRMLGYSRDELLAMFTPRLSADDDPLTPEDMDARLAGTAAGVGLLVERRYRRKDGTSLAAEVSLSQLPDGRLQRNIRDISDRLAAEAALRESERSLAEAQRIAHIGSWEWDLSTDAARRSAELHRIYGVEPGSIPNTSEAFLAFVHPDDRARVQAVERAATAGGGRYELEYRAVWPDGSIRIIHDEAELIRDASGAPARMVGTVQDITERVAAEGERARLAAAVEQTADAVWMKDVSGSTVLYVNRSFSRLYGYEPDEIVGKHAAILDSGHHRTAFFDAIWAAVATGATWAGTIVNRRKDGTFIEVEAVVSGIRDASNRLVSYMQTDRDVTHERALERAQEREVRERETISAALARIDPEAAGETIAAEACAVINGLLGVDSTMALALDDVTGIVLAAVGRLTPVFAPGTPVAADRVAYLRERGSGGPWAEEWRPDRDAGRWTEAITAAGLVSTVYAPLRGPRGVIGVVGIGSHDRATAPALVEHVPALASFASTLGALLAPRLEDRRRELEARSAIQAVLDGSGFVPFFQPIVDLRTESVVGYEALSRFTDGIPPDVRFATADRAGLGIELEVATMRAALDAAANLPPDAYLSLNASPALIASGELRALLRGCARAVVLEITEHVVIDDYPALRASLAALVPTVRLAVDDAGAGYASLRHILELAPDFVKLDVGLVRGIDTDPARQALLAGMGYFAVKRRIRLVAEGIETAAELEALRALGISHGQGYLLGRPQDGLGAGAWSSTAAPRTDQ